MLKLVRKCSSKGNSLGRLKLELHTSSNLNQTRTQKQQLELPKSVSNLIGEKPKKVVNPLKTEDFFQVKQLIKLEELFKARCHYGHHAGLRSPWMSEYLFGTRKDIDIIDLDKTVPLFQQALNFIAHIAFRGGIILFITRYAQHIPLVERTAKESGEYAHCRAWRNGTFTDSTRRFGSVIRLPDVVVMLHTQEKLNETHGAIAESAKMLIPTVAVCDSDCDPSQISFPIPGNDDSITAVRLYSRLFQQAILAAKAKRAQLEKDGVSVDYEAD